MASPFYFRELPAHKTDVSVNEKDGEVTLRLDDTTMIRRLRDGRIMIRMSPSLAGALAKALEPAARDGQRIRSTDPKSGWFEEFPHHGESDVPGWNEAVDRVIATAQEMASEGLFVTEATVKHRLGITWWADLVPGCHRSGCVAEAIGVA